jgi:hypothetical protein
MLSPVPFDLRVLRRSPLALDLYAKTEFRRR